MFCEKLISTVTMQGREAEHVQIASYAKNSLFKDRRHDYISKLWLPIHQPSLLTYHQTKESLIPRRVTTDPQHHCYCGFHKPRCNRHFHLLYQMYPRRFSINFCRMLKSGLIFICSSRLLQSKVILNKHKNSKYFQICDYF